MESSGKLTEPPETDLDYYARPENYTGSNLSTLTRFLVAKDKKEGKIKKLNKKKKKNINEERQLYKRYRHILPRDLYDSSSSSSSASSEDEQELRTWSETVTRHGRKHISQERDPQVETEVGNDGEEDSRLSTIVLNESEQTDNESESESGYGSRLRSQEEKFRDSPHTVHAEGDGTRSEAWPADDSENDPKLSHEISQKGRKSPRDSVVSLTGSVSTKTLTGSSLGMAGVVKLLSWRGSLQAYSNDVRKRLYIGLRSSSQSTKQKDFSKWASHFLHIPTNEKESKVDFFQELYTDVSKEVK
ncbi:hypothetical protein ElyMa_001015900 [Elysia marginata]|uniref:Uncharacterized protein n=1 Tax=Elysia marginata TaxID=1093978 RepID=A0AAV4HP06_9GAST|nr:hypothetical protein ElyMa_001015900 [Elysia marginata]